MNIEVLRKLGLSDLEIKIYMHLVKNGKASGYEISKNLGIYRAHLYDKLNNIIDKGLIGYVNTSGKRYYFASPSQKILDYIAYKDQENKLLREEAQKFVIDIDDLLKYQAKSSTNVQVFEGIEGVKFILRDIIRLKKDVMIMSIDEDRYIESMSLFMNIYFRDLVNNKIKEKVILSNNKSKKIFNKNIAKTTEYRIVDNEIYNPTNTFIYGNSVAIIVWEKTISTILIESELVAKTYKANFDNLWKNAKKA